MPRYIIKLHSSSRRKDYYLEWSTVVDAPVTRGMSLDEFKEYYRNHSGDRVDSLDVRLLRVEKTGTSAFNETLKSVIADNKAGENGKHLTFNELLGKYCF